MVYRDQLHELTAALEAATKELADLRRRVERTMKNDLACPACSGQEIAHVFHVLDQDDGARKAKALVQPSIWSSKTEGKLEAFICRGCGLVEWYAKDPRELKEREKFVRFLRGPDGG